MTNHYLIQYVLYILFNNNELLAIYTYINIYYNM